jgi:hypothetical protein
VAGTISTELIIKPQFSESPIELIGEERRAPLRSRESDENTENVIRIRGLPYRIMSAVVAKSEK